MSEALLVRKILAMIEKRRLAGAPIEAVKQHGANFAQAGEPDIDCVCDGQSYKLEAKFGRNKLTKLQAERLRRWRAAGAVTGVVRSVEEVERLLDGKI